MWWSMTCSALRRGDLLCGDADAKLMSCRPAGPVAGHHELGGRMRSQDLRHRRDQQLDTGTFDQPARGQDDRPWHIERWLQPGQGGEVVSLQPTRNLLPSGLSRSGDRARISSAVKSLSVTTTDARSRIRRSTPFVARDGGVRHRARRLVGTCRSPTTSL